MERKLDITESGNEALLNEVLEESFYPASDKVKTIKLFLDKTFKRQVQDDIDSNGYPKKQGVVVMLSSDGVPLKTMSMRELLLMLDDKFNYMVKDEKDRRKFLKQVIADWFNKKITKHGLLTVNFL